MLPIHHHGQMVAIATTDGGVLLERMLVLEPDHPYRRFAQAMLLYGAAVLAGEVDERYTDARAELFARTLLIPDEEFDAGHLDHDYRLAQRFNVPLEQVALKRNDLVTWWDRPTLIDGVVIDRER
jgi:hypothetical protein